MTFNESVSCKIKGFESGYNSEKHQGSLKSFS